MKCNWRYPTEAFFIALNPMVGLLQSVHINAINLIIFGFLILEQTVLLYSVLLIMDIFTSNKRQVILWKKHFSSSLNERSFAK